MHKIDILPLSVNKAWQGQRFKTKNYIKYQRDLLLLLPKITIPKPPYSVYYEFGFSNKSSDYDNPIKQFQDILCKKYHFNDSLIFRAVISKKIVKKGCEYIIFEIAHFQDDSSKKIFCK